MLKLIRIIVSVMGFFHEKKNRLIFPSFLMIISNCISLIIPFFVMKVLDQLKNDSTQQLGNIILIMFGWFLSLVIVAVIEYYQRLSFQKYDNEILSIFHIKIIKYYSNKAIRDWAIQNSKAVADEIKKDMEDIKALLPGSLLPFLRNIIISVISTILLIVINWKLAVAVSLLIPAFTITYSLWSTEIKLQYKGYRQSSELFLSNLIEFLQTIPLMRIYNSSSSEIKIMDYSFLKYLVNQLDYFIVINKRQTYSKLLSSIAPIYLAFCALVFIHLNLITIGEIFAFWGIFSLMLNSISGISSYYINALKSSIVFDNIKEMIIQPQSKVKKEKTLQSINKIQTKNLVFTYNGNRKKLIKIPSFSLNKGEIIHIQGTSGIGKTTLIKMLIGILEPLKGEILINGILLENINKNQYLELIGYVEQNGYLYSRTLRENILLGRVFEKEKWDNTIKVSNLLDFINSLHMKEYQLLGENSLQMSGGERQRILIARALYNNPQWLFLDEPFTGIDINNQIEIKKVLEKLSNKLTIVIVTHEKYPLLNVNKVVKLEHVE